MSKTTSLPHSIAWADVLTRHLPAGHISSLGAALIGIAGAGGLGSNCAVLLARSGIHRMRVADPDIVDISNLNRQYFTPPQIGRPKVEALAEHLRFLNPGMDLEIRQEALDASSAVTFFGGCDIVVEAVDLAETKHLLVDALLAAGHIVVSASGIAGWGADMRRQVLGPLTVVGDFSTATGPEHPPLAPRVMMAAAMQADEVLRRILGENIGNTKHTG